MGQLVPSLGVNSNLAVQNMAAAARRVPIFPFLDRHEKGFVAKAIRAWLHLSPWTRQPGSAPHPCRLLSRGLSYVNLLLPWSCPSPVAVGQSSVNLVARLKWEFYFAGFLGPPGQVGLDQKALATLELTSNVLFTSDHNPSSLPPTRHIACVSSHLLPHLMPLTSRSNSYCYHSYWQSPLHKNLLHSQALNTVFNLFIATTIKVGHYYFSDFSKQTQNKLRAVCSQSPCFYCHHRGSPCCPDLYFHGQCCDLWNIRPQISDSLRKWPLHDTARPELYVLFCENWGWK